MRVRSPACIALVLALAAPAAAQRRPATTPVPAPAPAPAAAPAPATAPAPAASPAPAPADEGSTADVDALRQEYLALRDRLFRSRARAAAVASALYSSRLRIELAYATGRQQVVTRAMVRLDGASVADDVDATLGDKPAPRFEGYVAPGRHLVTVRVEAAERDDERFVTATESTFVVLVPQGKDVVVTARAGDDGDIGHAWKKEGKGSYDLGLKVSIKSVARAAAGGGRGDAGRASR
jgi:hypothetical protein